MREQEIDLGHKENKESDKSVENYDQCKGARLENGTQASSGVVGGDEGEPQNAEGIDGKVDEFRFVEVLRDLSRTESKVEGD